MPIERRLRKIQEALSRIRRELEVAEGELELHRHLDDDAVRDAAVGGPAERAEARRTTRDVAGLDAVVRDARARIDRLERERDRLLDRLFGA